MPGTAATADDTIADEVLLEEQEPGDDAADDAGAEGGEHDDDTAAGADGDDTASGTDASADAEDETLVVTIGDEPAAEDDEADGKPAPAWLKDLRKANREKDRRIRELEAKVAERAVVQEAETEVGPEPELKEFADADEIAKYRADFKAWTERKAKHEAKQAERQRAEEQQRQAWQSKLENFRKAATALKVPDFEDAEEAALSTLSQMQQGIILKGAARPELLVYALGKNTKEAKRLAAITDPVEFTWAAAQLEGKIKTMPKKQAPAPERRVNGGGSPAAAVVGDKQLAKLHDEAQRTGDYTKFLAAKRAARERSNKAA